VRCYLWRNNEYCSLYGVTLITTYESQELNIIRRSFLRNQEPVGLVGLEYLEEEYDFWQDVWDCCEGLVYWKNDVELSR